MGAEQVAISETPATAGGDALRGAKPPQASLSFDLEERRWLLIFGDALASCVASFLALGVWGLEAGTVSPEWFRSQVLWVPLLAGGWLLAGRLTGAYEQREPVSKTGSLGRAASTGATLLAFYLVLYFLAPRSLLPRIVMLGFVEVAVFLSAAWRYTWGRAHSSRFKRRVLIFGSNGWREAIAELLSNQNGIEVVATTKEGFADNTRHTSPESSSRLDISVESLLAANDTLGISEIVLADTPRSPAAVAALLKCLERGIAVTSPVALYETLTGRVKIAAGFTNLDSILPLSHPATRSLYRATKRILDFFGSILGLAVTCTLFPFIAIAIKIDSGGSILYRQLRSGRGGRPFAIWKFRTMQDDAEQSGVAVWARPEDPRVTRVGWWLRRSRLDELPQLWNVLQGDMSLVGPRPERPEIEKRLEHDLPLYRLRLAVKPGLASWHAVNSRYVDNIRGANERLEYDLFYIKHQSMWLDIRIVIKAAGHILLLKGQ